jgi:hypothetical protein
MKALYFSYGFLLQGSFGQDLLVVSTQFLSPCPIVYSLMGLLGLISNHLVSLHIISPRYGLVYTIGVYVVGYDGYYGKGISLRMIFISWLYFYIVINRFDWGKL